MLVLLTAPKPSMPPPSDDPARFDEAIASFRSRVPISDEDYEELSRRNQRQAFHVAGATSLDVVDSVWDALDAAIAEGTSFDDFKDAVAEKLFREWGRIDPTRLEVIFRTNVQTAYNQGRLAQMRDKDVLEVRPYGRYNAIMDRGTCPICGGFDGLVLPADDKIWSGAWPPLHHQCRCRIDPLTDEQAHAHGIDESAPEGLAADDGFGEASEGAIWRPDLSRYPKPLREAYERKFGSSE